MALRAVAGPRNPTSIGTTPPVLPQMGQMWWNLDDVKLYVWDGAEWVVTVNTPEVTGGTGSGGNSYDMRASGAAGDGVTDDTAKIQAWLNTLPVGVEVILPANHQFLINSADLTIPPGLTLRGQGAFTETPAGIGNLVGPAFILNPAYSLVIGNATRLSNFKVLRQGLLTSPTQPQINAAVAAWAAEAPLLKTSASTASGNTLPFASTTGVVTGMTAYGPNLPPGGTTVATVTPTSVTFASVTTFPVPPGAYVRFGNSIAIRLLPNQGGANFDRLFILGFNTAMLTESGRFFLDTVQADCTTILAVLHGGDAAYISKLHCIGFYGTPSAGAMRPGPAFLLTRADGWDFDTCSTIGWATGFVLSGTSGATLRRCWAEVHDDSTTVTTGFRTESAINVITFSECSSSSCSIGFDFQHTSGTINALGCVSAPALDGTAIAHYRLGPGSWGEISSPIVNANGITPFVVQPGVGSWQIIASAIYGAPSPWIAGAAADLANIVAVGGPAGTLYTLTSPANFEAGIQFNDTIASAPTDLSHGVQFYPGYGIGMSPSQLNLISGQFLNIQSAAGTVVNGIIGFNGHPPVAQPTVTGSLGGNAALASLIIALHNYGLIINGASP